MAKGKGKKGGGSKSEDLKTNPDVCLATGDFTLPNGDSYSGGYCAHRAGLIWRQGHGIYKTHDGQIYEGEWADDKLTDNSELTIKYPSGSTFRGRLLKNKYSGPGVYSLGSSLDVSCQFSGNKPVGEIALIDSNGKLWRGEAKANSALLLPENIFYLNLPECRGKGICRIEEDKSFSSDQEEELEEEFSEEYWKNLIFGKSKKTDSNIDFTDCKWWRQFEKFKEKKASIIHKMANDVELSEEEQMWLGEYRGFKELRRLQRIKKDFEKKKSSEATFDLNATIRDPDYTPNYNSAKIFYRSKRWEPEDEDFDLPEKPTRVQSRHSTNSFKSVITNKRAQFEGILPQTSELTDLLVNIKDTEEVSKDFVGKPSRKLKSIGNIPEILTFGDEWYKMPNEKDLKPVCLHRMHEITPPKQFIGPPILHFTKERKEQVLPLRVQQILEQSEHGVASETDKLFAAARKRAKEFNKDLEEIEDSETMKDTNPEDSNVEEVTKPGTPKSTAVPPQIGLEKKRSGTLSEGSGKKLASVDALELADQERRILGYIEERVARWEIDANTKKAADDEYVKARLVPRLIPHLHSIGLDTSSISDIPMAAFIDMFKGGHKFYR